MRPKKTEFLGSRFREKEAKLVKEFVELRDETVSTFLRRAALKELSLMGMIDKKTLRVMGIEVPKRE